MRFGNSADEICCLLSRTEPSQIWCLFVVVVVDSRTASTRRVSTFTCRCHRNTVVTNSKVFSLEFKRIHTRDDHALENIFLVFTNFLDCSCIVGLQSSSRLLNILKRCLQYLQAVLQFTESDRISPNLTESDHIYRIWPTEVIPKTSYMMPISDGYVDFLLYVNLCTFCEFHV